MPQSLPSPAPVPLPDPERFGRLAALFDEVADAEPDARAARLTELRAEDPDLADELLRLLDAEALAGEVEARLQSAVDGVADDVSTDHPSHVGPYEIVGRLGQGAMGTVFEAVQQHPARRVALKLLRLDVLGEDSRRRLALEGQLLAGLDHPCIAKVHAVGEVDTPTGRLPYLALELIEGEPITTYAQAHGLSLDQRLLLLAKVCDAIAHAHRRGVIHRDLKPANILVTADGRPKVLDFGIGRLHDAHGDTTHTVAGTVLGTPGYMSPEQAAGDIAAIDTRADVYALGSIGVELVAGKPLFEFENSSLAQRLIRVASGDRPPVATLATSLRGDLGVVLSKAVALEPARRYPDVPALADDLDRVRDDRPIVARPPSRAYAVRMFVRRHKALVATAAVALLALLGGLVASLGFARSEASARARADAGRRRAQVLELDARHATYAARIQSVDAALRADDASMARWSLYQTDPELRRWEFHHLTQRLDQSLAHVPVPLAREIAPAFTRDGHRIAAVLSDESVSVYTRETRGWRRTVLPPEFHETRQLTWLDDDRLVACVREGDLLVYDMRESRLTHRLPGTPEREMAAAAHPEGRELAVVQWQVRRPKDETPLLRVPVPPTAGGVTELHATPFAGPTRRGIHMLAYAPHGRTLVASGKWREIFVYAMPEERLTARLSGFPREVAAMRFSQDGRRLLTVTRMRSAHEITFGAEVESATLVDPLPVPARSVAWLEDESGFVTGHIDGTLRRWDLDGRHRRTWSWSRTGAAGPTEGSAIRDISIGPHGTWSAAEGDGLRSWSLGDARHTSVLRGHRGHAEGNRYPFVYGVAVSPDSAHIASAGWDETLRIWDAGGQALAVLEDPRQGRAYESAFLDADTLIAVSHRGVHRWNLESGTMTHVHASRYPSDFVTVDPTGTVAAVGVPDFGPLGLALLSTADLTPVEGLHWSTTPEPAPRGVTAACFGRTGVLAVGRSDGRCHLVDPADGTILRTFRDHAQRIRRIRFDPSGTRVAFASEDGAVTLRDVERHVKLRRIAGHSGAVHALAFSPDGTRLVTGDHGGWIRIFDAQRGTLLLRMRGHASYVHDLAFAPDGSLLVSASGDNTVRIWRARVPEGGETR